MAGEWENWDYPRHVGMAATLFRRERLERLTFRWEPGKCECRCCCDDLRRAGFGIGYLAGGQGVAPAGSSAPLRSLRPRAAIEQPRHRATPAANRAQHGLEAAEF